jgi:hypothetical protein
MNTEVDGGTCWQCGTKRDRIAELKAELARIKPAAQAIVNQRDDIVAKTKQVRDDLDNLKAALEVSDE